MGARGTSAVAGVARFESVAAADRGAHFCGLPGLLLARFGADLFRGTCEFSGIFAIIYPPAAKVGLMLSRVSRGMNCPS
jgi:hypothetical protein